MRRYGEELRAELEALLFAAGDPLDLGQLAQLTDCPEAELQEVLELMAQDYAQDTGRGLLLRRVEQRYFLATKPEYKEVLEALFTAPKESPLSQAAYEVLAVVAYNQPCTRAEIEAVRGVNSDHVLAKLEERGLVAVSGTLDAPGRPSLYCCTEAFLQRMNLSSTSELPAMELLMYGNLRDLEQQLEASRIDTQSPAQLNGPQDEAAERSE